MKKDYEAKKKKLAKGFSYKKFRAGIEANKKHHDEVGPMVD